MFHTGITTEKWNETKFGNIKYFPRGRERKHPLDQSEAEFHHHSASSSSSRVEPATVWEVMRVIQQIRTSSQGLLSRHSQPRQPCAVVSGYSRLVLKAHQHQLLPGAVPPLYDRPRQPHTVVLYACIVKHCCKTWQSRVVIRTHCKNIVVKRYTFL